MSKLKPVLIAALIAVPAAWALHAQASKALTAADYIEIQQLVARYAYAVDTDGQVIAHTTNCVEHPELVAERIMRYTRMVGRENVIAGVDCGFAQGVATARVHPSIMWEKFRMLAEGARLASQRLW